MSVARVREINARLRAAGITVHEWPGWEARGNGQSSAYEGGLIHNTVSPFGMTYRTLVEGRADLAGPLCNWGGNDDGSVTVVAAHPANHAGASGGKSMGPLPVTSTFNRRVLGIEFVAPGDVPLRPAQYRTGLIWARIVADVVGGGDVERVRSHFETSITGKIDISMSVKPVRSYDMRAFRAEAARAPETAMTTPAGVWDHQVRHPLTNWPERAGAWLSMTNGEAVAARDAARAAVIRLDALGVAVAEIRNKVNSFDPDNDGLVSTEPTQAAQEDWAQVVQAAEKGARDGAHQATTEAMRDYVARLQDAIEADNRDQARELLAALRDALPQREDVTG